MRKLQQFYIFKIASDRLRDSNWKIEDLSLEQARLNGEVIQISNSQMVRTIFSITGRRFSQFDLDELLEKKKRITSKQNSKKSRKDISDILDEIDEYLFIPEIVNVEFEDRRHYLKIIKRGGFAVNGVNYVPFMSSAGQIRRSSSLFIDERIKEQITDIFNNGRDLSKEIVPAKFSAYYALYSSSSIPVSFPRLAVVPDLIIKTKKKHGLI